MYSCRKCNNKDMFIEKKSNNTGLYCQECGAWQKWLSKDEIRLFNHKNNKNNNTAKNNNYKIINDKLFENNVSTGPFDEINSNDEIKEPMITINIPLRLFKELKDIFNFES